MSKPLQLPGRSPIPRSEALLPREQRFALQQAEQGWALRWRPGRVCWQRGREIIPVGRRTAERIAEAFPEAAWIEGAEKPKRKPRRTMTDDDLKRFGKQVRAQRNARGLNQEELAERVGISRAYLSRIERGRATSLSFRLAQKLSNLNLIETTTETKPEPKPETNGQAEALRYEQLTAGETAKRFGLHITTVGRWAREGLIDTVPHPKNIGWRLVVINERFRSHVSGVDERAPGGRRSAVVARRSESAERLTPDEAAERFGVHRVTVSNWAREGLIDSVPNPECSGGRRSVVVAERSADGEAEAGPAPAESATPERSARGLPRSVALAGSDSITARIASSIEILSHAVEHLARVEVFDPRETGRAEAQLRDAIAGVSKTEAMLLSRTAELAGMRLRASTRLGRRPSDADPDTAPKRRWRWLPRSARRLFAI